MRGYPRGCFDGSDPFQQQYYWPASYPVDKRLFQEEPIHIPAAFTDAYVHARHMREHVFPAMNALRTAADKARKEAP